MIHTETEIKVGEHVSIRIQLCAARRTGWLSAVRMDANRLRVTAEDPIWKGALVNMNDPGLRIERITGNVTPARQQLALALCRSKNGAPIAYEELERDVASWIKEHGEPTDESVAVWVKERGL